MPKRKTSQTAWTSRTAEDALQDASVAAQAASASARSIKRPDSGAWNSFAVTKFRTPVRRDLIARPDLVRRACGFVLDRRVLLVCAPAGFGKSTLLLQLCAELSAPTHAANHAANQVECAWLSFDDNDNDINRLLVSILGALRNVVLEWEIAPATLASQVLAAGPQSHTAVAAIVNALASYQGERLLLILDDLHRVTDVDALGLLGDLIDRLPPEVGVAIGSRTAPAIPLARWRARGELGEFTAQDLQFSQEDTKALADLRPDHEWSPACLEQVFQRTEGWAAGLQLMFAAAGNGPRFQPAPPHAAQRHLFDFFAQEVLADLPAELREFVLHCSILPELTPTLCNAVTGRNDAQAILNSLYRCNVFLTALDERIPVLRFHDLFAEFLQAQLAQHHPGRVQGLHARAAQVDTNPMRAVAHWLKAEAWQAAITAMKRSAESLLAEGGVATITRWIAQLPQIVANDSPDVAYLQGLCAQSHWRFMHAANYFDRAAQGYRARGELHALMDCIALLPRPCISVGQLDRARKALHEADALPMPLSLQLICQGARAWLAAANEPDACAPALAAIADSASQDPGMLLPAINDIFAPFMFALPNVMPQMLRLRELCRQQLAAGTVHWQLEAMSFTPWPELWRGERQCVGPAFEELAQMMLRLAVVPVLTLMDNTLRATQAAFHDDFATAIRFNSANPHIIKAINDEGFTNTWYRFSVACLAHLHWMAGDAAQLEAFWPEMSPHRTPAEWPMIATCRALLRGRIDLLAGRFDEAETMLAEAVRLQTLGSIRLAVGDARCSLATSYLLRGREDLAAQTFLPVFENALADDAVGVLLMEPKKYRARLLGLLPPEMSTRADARALLARLSEWDVTSVSGSIKAGTRASPSALDVLSDREREVLTLLANGDSNKQIARTLELSPHTVKRHVANILAKLDCSTRGQAAAQWRAAQVEGQTMLA